MVAAAEDHPGCSAKVVASAPETKPTIAAAFNFAPFVGGSAIAASWIVVACPSRRGRQAAVKPTGAIFAKTFSQTWGAFLVGIFIFGLAYVFNYSGMASSLAKGFSGLGAGFIVVAPILGFIGVALSGRNTSTNAMFGKFQALVGVQLGMPPLLLPTPQFGRRRNRQADRAANRQRRRLDEPFRAQRGRGHPPQPRLDHDPARLSRADRGRLLSLLPRYRGAAEIGTHASSRTWHAPGGRRDARREPLKL